MANGDATFIAGLNHKTKPGLCARALVKMIVSV